jgi:tetratricopeptide (TPR) repeat protein
MAGVFLLTLAGAAGASEPQKELPGFGPEARELPYESVVLGSAACGRCHAEHFRNQKTHHMALTGLPVNETTRDLWFSEDRLAQPVNWTSNRKDSSPPRYRIAGDGVVLEAEVGSVLRSVRVAAVFGSGLNGLTPLSAEPGRSIRELRLSFSSAGGHWFTTPGSEGDPDPLGTPKSSESARECLGCHSTLLAWNANTLDPSASIFGVQCERCHGPGSAHVSAAEAGSEDLEVFNPAYLRADEQVRFCGECHRQPIDVEPLDVMRHAPALARHAGVGLMLSACFRLSPAEGRLTCVECHDPHRNLDAAVDPFQKTCLRCHSSPANEHRYETVTVESNCIPCHMPLEKKAFHGLAFTDHWIHTPGARQPLDSPEKDAYLRYLEGLYREAIGRTSGRPEKSARLRIHLGETLYGLGQREAAFEWLREGLDFTPSRAQRLKAAGMFDQGGKADEALKVLSEVAEEEPDFAEAHYELGKLQLSKGRDEEAIAHFRRAVVVDPRLTVAQQALGRALLSSGMTTDALVHLVRAVELMPKDAEAQYDLAVALRKHGELDAALARFREAERLSPGSPTALAGMAAGLATHPDPKVRDPQEAVRLGERAAALTRYRHPLILDSLALAYASAGLFEEAVGAGEKALELAAARGAAELAEQIQSRLEAYKKGRVP